MLFICCTLYKLSEFIRVEEGVKFIKYFKGGGRKLEILGTSGIANYIVRK